MEKRFTLKNRGMRIVGIKSIVDDHPRPTVILLHGFTGSKNEAHDLFVKTSDRLVSRGINAVRFDFRYGKTEANQSESEGTIADMTPSKWISDARRITTMVSGMDYADPSRIALLGLSMGGLTAICEAASDKRIAAVAVWSAPSDLSLRLRTEKLSRAFQAVVSHGFKEFKRSLARNIPRKSISHISPRPVLIVGGSNDRVVPIEEAKQLFESAKDPRSLYLIGGADHTFNKHEAEVISTTTAWLVSVLKVSPR